MKVAVGVPTLNNFQGLAELFASLWGADYTPFVISNWVKNIGVSASWNEILKATRGYQLTIVCNDDITFHSEAFTNLLTGWQNKPEDALMVTATNRQPSSGEWYEPAPDYSCFAVNPDIYLEAVGWFDENFSPAYFEDNDSHYRIKLAGHEAYCYNMARINHKGSQTQNANPKSPIVTPSMFERNRAYYSEKWGGWPGQEKYKVPYGDISKDWKYWRDC